MAVNTSVIQNAFHTPSGHKMGQKICGGHDNDHIAEKGNYKGLRAFSKAFHGTGSGNGYSRKQESRR